MVSIEPPDGGRTTYVYAANNQKDEFLYATETDAGSVKYLWDDQNVLQEYDVATEARYTYNPQPYGDLVSQRRESEPSYYHFDGNLSTSALTDGSGVETDRYRYTAFGTTDVSTGGTENPFTWKGEVGYYQAEGGLTYLRNRRYAPGQGRFVSADPIGLSSGESNFYRYVGNDPVNGVDPSGRWDDDDAYTDDGVYIPPAFREPDPNRPKPPAYRGGPLLPPYSPYYGNRYRQQRSPRNDNICEVEITWYPKKTEVGTVEDCTRECHYEFEPSFTITRKVVKRIVTLNLPHLGEIPIAYYVLESRVDQVIAQNAGGANPNSGRLALNKEFWDAFFLREGTTGCESLLPECPPPRSLAPPRNLSPMSPAPPPGCLSDRCSTDCADLDYITVELPPSLLRQIPSPWHLEAQEIRIYYNKTIIGAREEAYLKARNVKWDNFLKNKTDNVNAGITAVDVGVRCMIPGTAAMAIGGLEFAAAPRMPTREECLAGTLVFLLIFRKKVRNPKDGDGPGSGSGNKGDGDGKPGKKKGDGPEPKPPPKLPPYSGGKTSGVLRFGDTDIPLESGYKGPSASMPKGTPGMHGNIKSHVEAHAASVMRQQCISEATLYINRVPCPTKNVRSPGCFDNLPKMLPEGSRLRVVGPDGFDHTFVGLPD